MKFTKVLGMLAATSLIFGSLFTSCGGGDDDDGPTMYKVTYVTEKGDAPAAVSVESGKKINLPVLADVTVEDGDDAGKTFTLKSWKDGDNEAGVPGAEYTVTKNVTLTANWAEKILPAIDDNKTVESISIKTQPTKLEYELGDTLDTTGLVVQVKYEGEEELQDLTEADYEITGFDSSTVADEVTVTVALKKDSSKTATFKVSVKAKLEVVWDFTGSEAPAEFAFNGVLVSGSNVTRKIAVDKTTLNGYLGKGLWVVNNAHAEYRTGSGIAFDNRDDNTLEGHTTDETNPINVLQSDAIEGPFKFSLIYNNSAKSDRYVKIYCSESLETLFAGDAVTTEKESEKGKEISYENTAAGTHYVGVQLFNDGSSTTATDRTKVWTPFSKITLKTESGIEENATADQISATWAAKKATLDGKSADDYFSGWDAVEAAMAATPTTLGTLGDACKAFDEAVKGLKEYVAPESIELSANGSVVTTDGITLSTASDDAKTVTVSAEVLPEDASVKTVAWSLDNENATVVSNADGTATVTAVNVGTVTLTAKSTDKETVVATVTVKIVAQSHKVSFMDGDTELSSINVGSGEKATAPSTNPTKAGFKFTGWVTEADGDTPFNFENAITANTSVYAKWEEAFFEVFDLTNIEDQTITARFDAPDGTWYLTATDNQSSGKYNRQLVIDAGTYETYDKAYSYTKKLQTSGGSGSGYREIFLKIGKGVTKILRIDGGSGDTNLENAARKLTIGSTEWSSNAYGTKYVSVTGDSSTGYVKITSGANCHIYGIHVVEASVDTNAITVEDFVPVVAKTYKDPVISSGATVEQNAMYTLSASIPDADVKTTTLRADGTKSDADSTEAVTADIKWATVKDNVETPITTFDTTEVGTFTLKASYTVGEGEAAVTKSATKSVEVTEAGVTTSEVNVKFMDSDGTTQLSSVPVTVKEKDSVKTGSKVTKPTDPTAPAGMEFAGWMTEKDGTTEFNFDTLITEDTTLYAAYKKATVKAGSYGFSTGNKLPEGSSNPHESIFGTTKDQNNSNTKSAMGITVEKINFDSNGINAKKGQAIIKFEITETMTLTFQNIGTGGSGKGIGISTENGSITYGTSAAAKTVNALAETKETDVVLTLTAGLYTMEAAGSAAVKIPYMIFAKVSE